MMSFSENLTKPVLTKTLSIFRSQAHTGIQRNPSNYHHSCPPVYHNTHIALYQYPLLHLFFLDVVSV